MKNIVPVGADARTVFVNKENGEITVTKGERSMVINTPDPLFTHITADGLDFLDAIGVTLGQIKEDIEVLSKAGDKLKAS